MPVQTATYPCQSPSSSPYSSRYPERDRFHEANKPIDELTSSLASHTTTTTTNEGNHSQGEESSATENSPASSPEFTPSLMNVPSLSDTPGPSPDTPASVQSLSYRTFAPPKKARNLKNLAVNTTSTMQYGRAFSTAALPIQTRQDSPSLHGPATASFIKPAALPRRPSSKLGLTLMTPTLESRQVPTENTVPPTPSLMRPATLRRFQSSPLFPLNVPGSAWVPPTPIETARTSLSNILSEQDETDQHRFDLPQSREEKPEAYPDGPICIYEPNVDLYFEPTAEEASGYDVILNVASEVLNPFSVNKEETTEKQTRQSIVIGSSDKTKPEYIHVPWEHNTDIVPDLYRLVRLIDDRVQHGKRVLIHCQCGVSRSASLMVAYGLYKDPTITVQQAYDTVKRRSKWIGPNMSLIMQLQEFRTKFLHDGNNAAASSIQRARSKTSQGRLLGTTDKTPQSAPLQQKLIPPAITVVSNAAVIPGPSSAPSNLSRSVLVKHGLTSEQAVVNAVVTPSGQMLQLVTITPSENAEPSRSQDSLFSLPSTDFAMKSTHSLSAAVDDDMFGMMSPRGGSFPLEKVELPRKEQPAMFTPRSTEFAMGAIRPLSSSAGDDMYGLTSPRGAAFPPGSLF